MSEAYDWNPMPHKLNINCPCCAGYATFEFAEIVRVDLKKDVPFFESSNTFEYQIFKDSCGHKWHGAIYFANLHGGSTKAIKKLPDGYAPKNWDYSKYFIRSQRINLGAYICTICHSIKTHILEWPDDAYFSISYKNRQLWGFNRESTVDLRDFIASNNRKTSQYNWASFLLHIPTVFKKQNAREKVVKKLNQILSA